MRWLAIACLIGSAGAQEAGDLERLEEEYWGACAQYADGLVAAIRARRPRAEWPRDPTPGFVRRFSRLAETARGQPRELRALFWVFDHAADEKPRLAAFERLAEVATGSAAMAERLVEVPGYGREWEAPLRRIAAVRGPARAWARRHLVDLLWDHGFETDPERLREAERTICTLLEEDAGSTAAEGGEALAFAIRNLQVGRTPPDFTGEDASGRRISLSDFRGRVVVLVFWGFW